MSELNDKILAALSSLKADSFEGDKGWVTSVSKSIAAKAIEILVLEEMRTLLRDCYFRDNNNNQVLQSEINVLNAKINQLKQQ